MPSDSATDASLNGPDVWFGRQVLAGESQNCELVITESYSSRNVAIPVRVCRGKKPGPTVFVTAALHGDELNGTGAIRGLLSDPDWGIDAGTVLLVPVLNVLGFERHSRYLPDRRDLNRCFPGNASGSMASRLAKKIFDAIVRRCDYGVDLHTAAVRRTNFPNVRGDLDNEQCERLAQAFGAGIILHGKGPKGSFRREATANGCPTIVVEGGEVWKVESSVADCMVRGVNNVLIELGVKSGEVETPTKQAVIRKTKWIRAERGGFMSMHVAPGDTVVEGQAIASNSNLFAEDSNRLFAPFAGIVIGMTTLPAVQPGEPVVHIGQLASTKSAARHDQRVEDDEIQRTAHEHLATNIQVVEPSEDSQFDR